MGTLKVPRVGVTFRGGSYPRQLGNPMNPHQRATGAIPDLLHKNPSPEAPLRGWTCTGAAGGHCEVGLITPAGWTAPSRGAGRYDPVANCGDLVNRERLSPPNADIRPPTACLQVPVKVAVGGQGEGEGAKGGVLEGRKELLGGEMGDLVHVHVQGRVKRGKGTTSRTGVGMVIGMSGEQSVSGTIPASEASQGSEEQADLWAVLGAFWHISNTGRQKRYAVHCQTIAAVRAFRVPQCPRYSLSMDHFRWILWYKDHFKKEGMLVTLDTGVKCDAAVLEAAGAAMVAAGTAPQARGIKTRYEAQGKGQEREATWASKEGDRPPPAWDGTRKDREPDHAPVFRAKLVMQKKSRAAVVRSIVGTGWSVQAVGSDGRAYYVYKEAGVRPTQTERREWRAALLKKRRICKVEWNMPEDRGEGKADALLEVEEESAADEANHGGHIPEAGLVVVAGALSGENMGASRAMIRGVTEAVGLAGIMSRLGTSFEESHEGQSGRVDAMQAHFCGERERVMYGDDQVTQRSVWSIVNRNWLQDVVVNAVVKHVCAGWQCRMYDDIRALVTEHQATEEGLFDMFRVAPSGMAAEGRLIPLDEGVRAIVCVLHVQGNHWCLGVIDREDRTLTIHDSNGAQGELAPHSAFITLVGVGRRYGIPANTFRRAAGATAVQANGWDCGPLTGLNAAAVVRRYLRRKWGKEAATEAEWASRWGRDNNTARQWLRLWCAWLYTTGGCAGAGLALDDGECVMRTREGNRGEVGEEDEVVVVDVDVDAVDVDVVDEVGRKGEVVEVVDARVERRMVVADRRGVRGGVVVAEEGERGERGLVEEVRERGRDENLTHGLQRRKRQYFKVASWNAASWTAQKVGAASQVVMDVGIDVLCVQETKVKGRMETITGMRRFSMSARRMHTGGVMMCVRVDLNPELVVKSTNMLMVKLKPEGWREMFVIGVYRYGSNSNSREKMREWMEEIRMELPEEARCADAPVIMAGDFNFDLRKLERDDAPQWVWDDSLAQDRYTFQRMLKRGGVQRSLIDWVVTSPDVKAGRMKILPMDRLSDHAMVVRRVTPARLEAAGRQGTGEDGAGQTNRCQRQSRWCVDRVALRAIPREKRFAYERGIQEAMATMVRREGGIREEDVGEWWVEVLKKKGVRDLGMTSEELLGEWEGPLLGHLEEEGAMVKRAGGGGGRAVRPQLPKWWTSVTENAVEKRRRAYRKWSNAERAAEEKEDDRGREEVVTRKRVWLKRRKEASKLCKGAKREYFVESLNKLHGLRFGNPGEFYKRLRDMYSYGRWGGAEGS